MFSVTRSALTRGRPLGCARIMIRRPLSSSYLLRWPEVSRNKSAMDSLASGPIKTRGNQRSKVNIKSHGEKPSLESQNRNTRPTEPASSETVKTRSKSDDRSNGDGSNDSPAKLAASEPEKGSGEKTVSKRAPAHELNTETAKSEKEEENQQLQTSEPSPTRLKRTWQKVKKEFWHYYDGTKLLFYEVRVSAKLGAKMAAGYELSRRETRQLKRTIEDIVRLVPFSMFVIVPFAELLLPVALKIFPNMLPSTYESGQSKENKYRKLRDTRGRVSEFLRTTVSETGVSLPTNITPEQKLQFAEFFRKVRQSGESPSKELVVKVAQLFKDDVVLDNLSRPQLVAMAQYMNLQTFGTNMMLRYSIRYRMRQIKRDDRAIDYEGVDSLSVTELQLACRSRGIKTHGVSPARLRDDLTTWIHLRLKEKVPSTLLILCSAYTYGNADSPATYYDGITAVLSAIPEELYHEAELEISAAEATNKQRLEVLKEQQDLIDDENEAQRQSGNTITVKDTLNLDELDPTDNKATQAGAKVESQKSQEDSAHTDASEKEKTKSDQ